jgi:AcrR family transcriptional regulator
LDRTGTRGKDKSIEVSALSLRYAPAGRPEPGDTHKDTRINDGPTKSGSTRARRGGDTRRSGDTRRALLDAALTLFAKNGYHATSVPDIVQAAGVGHGTFYEYFESRRAILLALTAELAGHRPPTLASQSLAERIRSEIFWYLSDHVDHLTLSKVWHEASNFDPEIAEANRRERAHRVARVQRGIEATNQRSGIDPAVAAAALTAMLEEFAHRWFDEGDGPGRSAGDIVVASETIATMWLSVLGLDERPAITIPLPNASSQLPDRTTTT